jgi:predicted nucleotidyltransferase
MFYMIQNCSSWLVLKEFLDDPLKKFFVRELSRNIKLAPTSTKIHLIELEKEGFINKTKGLYTQYIANFDNEKFRFYKKINSLIKIQESGLINYLNEKASPNVIILFGSAAKGEDTIESDIDIYLNAETKEINLKEYEKKLKRKIQLFIYQDINKIPKELRNNIMNGIKLDGYITIWN